MTPLHQRAIRRLLSLPLPKEPRLNLHPSQDYTDLTNGTCQLQNEAFLAIVILCCFVTPETANCDFLDRHYDIIELFAGTARIARLGQAHGYLTLAHDRDYDRSGSEHGAMDLNGNAGFAQLGSQYNVYTGSPTIALGL